MSDPYYITNESQRITRQRFLTDFDNRMGDSEFKAMAPFLIKELCEKYGFNQWPTPSTNNQREGEKEVFDIYVGDMPQLPANQVWNISDIPDDQKHEFVDGIVKITAENFLKVFVMLGLKDGIESGVVNQATGDQFIMIFKKLKYPAAHPVEAPSLPVEEGAQWFNKWMQQKFEERGRYKQTFDEWTHYSKGACDMEETLRGQITSLRTQLSEAQKDRDAWKERFEKLEGKEGDA